MFGWHDNGEYHCPCGTIFGKNLKGEQPIALVMQHVRICTHNALQLLKTGHPLENPGRYNEETWELAVVEYLRGKWHV